MWWWNHTLRVQWHSNASTTQTPTNTNRGQKIGLMDLRQRNMADINHINRVRDLRNEENGVAKRKNALEMENVGNAKGKWT